MVDRYTREEMGRLWSDEARFENMLEVEKAVAEGRKEDVPKYFSDRWLADCTLFGPRNKVLEGLEAWRAAGVRTPIVVPSSAAGNQMKAIEEVLAAFG